MKFNLFCPAFHRSYTVFFDPGGSFSVPVDFPTLRVFLFLSVGTSLHIHIQHPIRVAGPFLNYFYLSFILPGCEGILFLVFSKCSMTIIKFISIFLMYLCSVVSVVSDSLQPYVL